MKSTYIWTIQTFIRDVFPKDFLVFIDNKYEYKGASGQFIYFPDSIWLATRHIIPPGEIADSFNEIRDILEKGGADMFTLINKELPGLQHITKDDLRVLEIEKRSLSETFCNYISEKYVYKGIIKGDHLYSMESIRAGKEDIMPGDPIKDAYFEIGKEMREKECDLFSLTDV